MGVWKAPSSNKSCPARLWFCAVLLLATGFCSPSTASYSVSLVSWCLQWPNTTLGIRGGLGGGWLQELWSPDSMASDAGARGCGVGAGGSEDAGVSALGWRLVSRSRLGSGVAPRLLWTVSFTGRYRSSCQADGGHSCCVWRMAVKCEMTE